MIALLTTATTALSVSGTLGGVKVSPLANGFVSGASVPLSTLWEKRGAVIFAVRRPGINIIFYRSRPGHGGFLFYIYARPLAGLLRRGDEQPARLQV